MSKQLADFLVELSQDPGKREAYKQDPDGTMDAAGLSAEDQEVLKSGDAQRLREYLGDDAPVGSMVMIT